MFTSKTKAVVMAGLAAMLACDGAFANAAAAAGAQAAAAAAARQRRAEQSSPLMPAFNDGYMIVHNQTQFGARTWVCLRDMNIAIVTDSGKQRVVCETKLFGKPATTTSALSPQEVLDSSFGKGITSVVGLAPYANDAMVIYYRIVADEQNGK